VLSAITALLAISGLGLWENLAASGWLGQAIRLLLDLGRAWVAVFNLAFLVVGALVRGLQHPVFIVYTAATAILAAAWLQIVKRRVFVYHPAMNH
jgi:hypothetical protein